MKKADMTYVVGSVYLGLTALFYCATSWFSIQVPRYYPLEHTWKWVSEKGVPSQGWYGMQAFAYLASGMVCVVLYLLLRRFSVAGGRLTPGATKAIGWVTVLILVSCMGYLLYHEFHKWGVFTALFS